MTEEKKTGLESGIVEYNPFEHRNVPYPSSNVRATANLIKACVGTGVLAMPLAMRNAGYGLGLVATITVGVICTHCVQILVKTSQDICKVTKVPSLGYSETCGAAFGNGPQRLRFLANSSKVFADIAMLLTYLGSCCVYVVLMAESMKQIVNQYDPTSSLSTEMHCLMLLMPLLLISQVKNLTFLAPFSMVANAMLMMVFAICLYYIFGQPVSFEGKQAINISKFPLFVSTVLFAMEGIGVVMPTENNMAKPQNFLGCPGVLFISMSIVTVLYTALGFLGYMRFGNAVTGSITLNLPMDEWPAILAKVLIILAIFFTFALQFYVPIDILWKYLGPKISKSKHNVAVVVLRGLAVTCSVGVGVAIPMLEQVIGIVGALFFSLLGIILPAIVETVFYWDNGSWFMVGKNAILVIIGLFTMISGCTFTVEEIIELNLKSHL